MTKVMFTMENGKMTSNMEMDKISLQMVIVMKVNTTKEGGTDMECKSLPMVVNTLETGHKGDSTVMVSVNGQTVANIMGNGRTVELRAKESILGLTGENMRDSTFSKKNGDMECLLRPMVLSTMETGKTGKSTVLEFNEQKMEKSRRVNGI